MLEAKNERVGILGGYHGASNSASTRSYAVHSNSARRGLRHLLPDVHCPAGRLICFSDYPKIRYSDGTATHSSQRGMDPGEAYMATTIERLHSSEDVIDREVAAALRKWQDEKPERGEARRLGRLPGQLNNKDSATVVSRSIISGASGFAEVSPEYSFEAIAVRHPDRFEPHVTALARERLLSAEGLITATADAERLELRSLTLQQLMPSKQPTGIKNPVKSRGVVQSFLRDPAVKAYVLQLADGHCECCDQPAPFIDRFGAPYLEVHHMKALADGGSDKVTNAVAICPNCHRAAHHSADAAGIRSGMYQKVGRLQRE